MKKSTKLLLASVLTIALLTLSGCNTWRGLGQDVESMGNSMKNAGN